MRRGIELALRKREIGIGEDHAKQQQRVCFFDHVGDGGIAGGAEICAEQNVGRALRAGRVP